MHMSAQTAGPGKGPRGRRRRLGKGGKAVGLASLATPVAAFVVNDLRKPDSLIKAGVKTLVRYVTRRKLAAPESVDISDKIEVSSQEEIKTNTSNEP
jgi:hypothetical protein